MNLTAKQIKKYDKYSVAQLIQKCQVVFNKFIRLRDMGLPCISCSMRPVQQAGHYLSAGHHSALRFDELNTNGQCLRCNHFLSGNLINYRIGLIRKIGLAKVEQLESTPKRAHKWDRFSLVEKIETYKEKVKNFNHQ